MASEQVANPSPHWNRARTCTNCKRRKVKCDLVRPRCGPCSRSMSYQDCEYASEGPTNVQRLEHQIAGLQAQIRGLEDPGSRPSTPSIRSSSALRSYLPPTVAVSRVSKPFQSISGPILSRLVTNLMEHARTQSGFFLGAGTRPDEASPALLTTVQLWAIHFSRTQSSAPTPESEFEAPYLARALSATADALQHQQRRLPDQEKVVLQAIQAHVLLANYFFRNVRIVEGRYQLGAAVGLVLAAGLHKLSGDPTEERINAFWTVYVMDCGWTVADGSPSNFPEDIQAGVDVPWPGDLSQAVPGSGTIQSFLSQPSGLGNAPPTTLRSKAAVVFERASALVARHQPREHLHPLLSLYRRNHVEMSPDDQHNFSLAFTNMDVLLQRLRQMLVTAAGTDPDSRMARLFASVAVIQLHTPFAWTPSWDGQTSRTRVLEAARYVLATSEQMQPGFENAIVGTLLTITFRVFLAAIAFRRSQPTLAAVANASLPTEPELRACSEHMLVIIRTLARGCKLIETQAMMIEEAYQGLE
ncbi:hypothetical protein HMN09_00011400 [Mycena chlorophos]|uniref:Zn(2)-C6 fungal-type domain-containing protein n=1 Tax=Mycena chlorophos TaxID=658473 RepID=A0A8H6WM05_MYCCL|nr:hypothetical protein HMN09_00011400 [Mycena chlorophos]